MKTKAVSTRVSEETFDALKVAANAQGVGHSVFARRIMEAVLGDIPKAEKPQLLLRRVKKVTVAVDVETMSALTVEAKTESVAISTWAGAVLAARFKKAPQTVQRERRMIMLSFHQLAGIARNINQMAKAMNRGILIGIDKTPTSQELTLLREEVQKLRSDLRSYASGRYAFQTAKPNSDKGQD